MDWGARLAAVEPPTTSWWRGGGRWHRYEGHRVNNAFQPTAASRPYSSTLSCVFFAWRPAGIAPFRSLCRKQKVLLYKISLVARTLVVVVIRKIFESSPPTPTRPPPGVPLVETCRAGM